MHERGKAFIKRVYLAISHKLFTIIIIDGSFAGSDGVVFCSASVCNSQMKFHSFEVFLALWNYSMHRTIITFTIFHLLQIKCVRKRRNGPNRKRKTPSIQPFHTQTYNRTCINTMYLLVKSTNSTKKTAPQNCLLVIITI